QNMPSNVFEDISTTGCSTKQDCTNNNLNGRCFYIAASNQHKCTSAGFTTEQLDNLPGLTAGGYAAKAEVCAANSLNGTKCGSPGVPNGGKCFKTEDCVAGQICGYQDASGIRHCGQPPHASCSGGQRCAFSSTCMMGFCPPAS